MKAYHITYAHHLPSIMMLGLVPQVPADMGGEPKGVYLFVSIEDAEDAVCNWFGERVAEVEEKLGKSIELLLLEVDVTGLYLQEGAGYELICRNEIEPSRILETTIIL